VDDGFVLTTAPIQPMQVGERRPLCAEEQLELMYSSLRKDEQLSPPEAMERIRNLPMTECDQKVFFTFMAKKIAK